MSPPLRLLPLGGLGEIGMNCLAIECERDIVIVDCGVMFPDRDLGVDVIHPDFSWLEARADRIRAVLLTHGHEDHIGALPYLLRRVNVPVYGPPYALWLVNERLREHDLPVKPSLTPTKTGERFTVGCFDVEPVRVTHSMVDATALVLRTPAGIVVHTGDFKIDHAPPDGEPFDARRLREVGDEGVRLLLSDSTNTWAEGTTGPEQGVAEALSEMVGEADKRVIVAIFASNVHRMRALFAAAETHGRKICFLGRSVHRHVEAATSLGYLPDISCRVVAADHAQSVERSRLLVIATGTQGEPRAAMARLAAGTHPALTLEEGDEVILSSRVIPGNEHGVFALINDLTRQGLKVRFRATSPEVHVSGHAHRAEQREMLQLIRPKAFMPVHGTLAHLVHHAKLAVETGVEQTVVVENGAVVEVTDDTIQVVDRAPAGRIHVDAGEEIPEVVLRDRALLAELGIAVVVVALDRNGIPTGTPDVITRGVVHEEEDEALLGEARQYVAERLAGTKWKVKGPDEEAIAQVARRAIKQFFAKRMGRKPLSYAVVVQVPT